MIDEGRVTAAPHPLEDAIAWVRNSRGWNDTRRAVSGVRGFALSRIRKPAKGNALTARILASAIAEPFNRIAV